MINGPGLGGALDAGDVIALCFNEALAPIGDADVEQIVVSDADGTTATIQNAAGSQFTQPAAPSTDLAAGPGTLCPANQTLLIAVTGAIAGTGGTTPGLQLGLTITDAGGIHDAANNLFNVAASTDKMIDWRRPPSRVHPPTPPERLNRQPAPADLADPGCRLRGSGPHVPRRSSPWRCAPPAR